MSGSAHANPDDLRRFAKDLRRVSSEVKQMSGGLTKTLSSLDWNDPVKNRIEADVKQVVKGLTQFADRLESEHARTVESKASKLEAYLDR